MVKLKVRFIQHDEEGRFDSSFSVHKTNHDYFSWDGIKLPDGHDMAWLLKLDGVDVKTGELSHGFANFKYHVENQDIPAVARHLRCTEGEARADVIAVVGWLIDTQYVSKKAALENNLTGSQRKDNELKRKKEVALNRCTKEQWPEGITHDFSVLKGRAKKVIQQRCEKKHPELFANHYIIAEVKDKLNDLEESLNKQYEARYAPHNEAIAELSAIACDWLRVHSGQTVIVSGIQYGDDDKFLDIDGEFYPVIDMDNDSGLYLINTGEKSFYVAEDSYEAGQPVEEYWRYMASNDPDEFAEMVGRDSLVSWGLGQLAGPGSVKVRSLEDWFSMTAEHPAEHWGSWDGTESEVTLSAALFAELEWNDPEGVVYRCD